MSVSYVCNICGTENLLRDEDNIKVPGPLCAGCNSAVRFRKVAFVVARDIFGGPDMLSQHETNNLRGVGLSDAPPYARVMSRFPGYLNTFYHQNGSTSSL